MTSAEDAQGFTHRRVSGAFRPLPPSLPQGSFITWPQRPATARGRCAPPACCLPLANSRGSPAFRVQRSVPGEAGRNISETALPVGNSRIPGKAARWVQEKNLLAENKTECTICCCKYRTAQKFIPSSAGVISWGGGVVCGTGKGRGCGPLCGGWVKVWKYLLFQAPFCPRTGVPLFQAEVHSPEGLGCALASPCREW